ncbi:MAG: hypothetical protein GVY20_02015 [Bacteroidetes bacterium]|jgi:hypothetical protein|nr:hypothetical protein [Bacteroidota bacterium]
MGNIDTGKFDLKNIHYGNFYMNKIGVEEGWQGIIDLLQNEYSLNANKRKGRVEVPGKQIVNRKWKPILNSLKATYPIVASKEEDSYRIKRMDISIDEWPPTIKQLKIDYSDRKVTAYCNHGMSFKKYWDSIKRQYRVAV